MDNAVSPVGITRVLNVLDPNIVQKYIPAAFFLHFPREFQTGPAAVEKHREFFRFTGMDFVKIQFEVDFPHFEVERPEDWAKIPQLEPGFFAPQLEVVQGLVDSMKSEALVVLTLYSPFMIAATIGGQDRLTRHLQEDHRAVTPGLERITQDLLVFVRECMHAGIDGFYHSTQGGESRRFSDPTIFDQAVKPFDLAVMTEINRSCRFNILHICDYHRAEFGGYDDLTRFLDYPGHVVNCSLEVGGRSLGAQEVCSLFERPFMGGMDRTGPLAKGSPDDARQSAREALAQRSRRFILGADCTVPGDTPWENLRAAIEEAHKA